MRHFGLVPQGTTRGDNGDRSFLDEGVRRAKMAALVNSFLPEGFKMDEAEAARYGDNVVNHNFNGR
jgi:hypothetical protein